tara:strand:- start:980 stop:1714 length:735 start_codon:yes stop_codon:yes gene_type:complete
MQNEILLAIIQAATEFLPISSSGHLALISNLIGEPNLFLITILHLASLLAVLIFLRKEIFQLVSFKEKYNKLWLFLIIATIPAAIFGFIFKSFIESQFQNNFLFLGFAFLFSSSIIFLTINAKSFSKLNNKNAFLIGLSQILALFPGVSRSGITISSGLFTGLKKEQAVKFSFLLFIPLVLGATILEIGEFYFSFSLLLAFIICFILSLVFLNILYIIVKNNKFWLFSIYGFIIGLLSLWLHFK